MHYYVFKLQKAVHAECRLLGKQKSIKKKLLLYVHYQIRNNITCAIFVTCLFFITGKFYFLLYIFLVTKSSIINIKSFFIRRNINIVLKIRTINVYIIPLQDNLQALLTFILPEDLTLTSVWRTHHSSQFLLPFLWTLLSSNVVKQIGSQEFWVLVLVLPLTSCVILIKSLTSPGLSFPICRMSGVDR